MKIKLLLLCIYTPFLVTAQNWEQLGTDIDGEFANDLSGESISLSADGNILAIGAAYASEEAQRSGHVRVYENVLDNWEQLGSDIEGGNSNSFFGDSVSLSSDGTILAVGEPFFNSRGQVRIYKYEEEEWNQIGLSISGEILGGRFGESINLNADGTILAVGASRSQQDGEFFSGEVKVFKYDGISWIQMGLDIEGDAANDYLGYSLNLNADGTILAVGAPGFNDSDRVGYVRVFSFENDEWIQIGPDIEGESNNLGYSLDLDADGTILAVGIPLINNEVGLVKVFSFENDEWIQIGLDIEGESFLDRFGESVSINSLGNILAIGSKYSDNNGEDSGQVKVFDYDGMEWIQKGLNIEGEATNDFSGYSIGLSNDGDILAIGAPFNAGNGEDSGHVRVFEFIDTTLSLNDNLLAIEAFKVYPNPTAEALNVNIPEVTIEKVYLYNLEGALIFFNIYNENNINIPVQNLSNGTYVVKIETDKGEVTKQFVKE